MIEISGENLTLRDVIEIARKNAPVQLSEKGKVSLKKARVWLETILSSDQPVYGINTGFGVFSDRRIKKEEARILSRNLIISHAVGTGSDLDAEVVRAAMLIRANNLTKGNSGVRIELVATLLEMLNKDVIPVIPEQGSLGSSGDLSPLAHLALVLTKGESESIAESGLANFQGKRLNGLEAMKKAGLKRIVLEAKEGLAITNGAAFSAAIASLAVSDAQQFLRIADIALALSLEASLGCTPAFDKRLHQVRNHPGQNMVAAHVLELIKGSTLVDSTDRVQDAYSLRCAPQVHGAASDTVQFVSGIIEREINSSTDNPLLFEPGIALSGGNFHGEPIGMAMDFLSIALAEIGAISERRVYRLVDSRLSDGLPPMLVDSLEAAGVNSGMMMLQYTSAALALENQNLAVPDSIHSLPTSAGQEDLNANAMTAARHARMVNKNLAHILAIELYTAARAVDLRLKQRPNAKLGSGTSSVYNKIREAVPYHADDRLWGEEVERVKELVTSGLLD